MWMQLGFAALQIKDWNLAVSAYKKYCALEQSVNMITLNSIFKYQLKKKMLIIIIIIKKIM